MLESSFAPLFFGLPAKVLRAADVAEMLTDNSHFTRSLTSEVVFPASYRGRRSEGTHGSALRHVSPPLRIEKERKNEQFTVSYLLWLHCTGIKRCFSKEELRHGLTSENVRQIKSRREGVQACDREKKTFKFREALSTELEKSNQAEEN